MTHEVNLFYGNDDDGWENLGKFKDEQEMNKEIKRKIRELGFKSYYFRCWLDGDGTTYVDFGSWKNFFKYKYCNVKV